MSWQTLSRIFDPFNLLKGLSRTNTARERLVDAYQAVFEGRGGRDDAEIVLADLAAFTGFFGVFAPGVTDAELRYAEGMRAVYGRIHARLRLSAEERVSLQEAAKLEGMHRNREGDV